MSLGVLKVWRVLTRVTEVWSHFALVFVSKKWATTALRSGVEPLGVKLLFFVKQSNCVGIVWFPKGDSTSHKGLNYASKNSAKTLDQTSLPWRTAHTGFVGA